MKTLTEENILQSCLQEIVECEPYTIRYEVALEALSSSECSSIKTFFSDLFSYGCASGMIGQLIYYSDTHKFFEEHYNEIEELRIEFEESIGQPLKIPYDLKNTLTWFAFEETARQIASDLNLEI